MTLSNAFRSIQHYKKNYGVLIALRVTYHFMYRYFKKSSLNSKDFIVKTNGEKMHVLPNDRFGTSAELLIFKTHEPISTNIIQRKLKPGMNCLEIGANIGYYTIIENKIIGNTGRIIAIEPSPVNFNILQKNIDSLNLSNISLYNIAAGSKDGITKFLIYEGAGNSCMVISEGNESRWPGKLIDVPIKNMDLFLEELDSPKIDFLRMDVEGYENYVLEGLTETLKKYKPIIYIEVHVNIMGRQKTITMIDNLKCLGYNVTSYIPRELDTPLIGSINDIKNYNIDQILDLIRNEKNPSFLMLTFENHT